MVACGSEADQYDRAAPSNAIDFNAAFNALRADADTIANYQDDVDATNYWGGGLNWNASMVNPYLSLEERDERVGAHVRPAAPDRHDHHSLDAV